MTTVAVMQPCFMPYAGYFRLFAAVDLFVIYDCVQFPRRGLIHRNRLPDHLDRAKWLTLPIAKAPREALIKDLGFADNAETKLQAQFSRFPCLDKAEEENQQLMHVVRDLTPPPCVYLTTALKTVCEILRLPFNVRYSSEFNIDPGFKGPDRVMEILEHLKASDYVNTPGGRKLYNVSAFAKRGIEIRFLDRYNGPYWSILHRLMIESPRSLAEEIRAQA